MPQGTGTYGSKVGRPVKMRRGGMRGGRGYDSPEGKIRLHEEMKRRSIKRKAAKEDPISREDIAGPVKRKSAPAKKPAATKRFGAGSSKTITHKGKSLANVSADQLKKTGMSLRQYMNAWNKSGKRPRSGDTSKQPVMARTAPRSGDTSKQPVMAGRVTRGPRSGDTSKQPVMAGKVTKKKTTEQRRKIAARNAAAKNRKGLSLEDSRSIGLTGTRKRENDAKIRANKAKREAALEKDRLAEKAKIDKAEKVAGVTALTGGAAALARKYATRKAPLRLYKPPLRLDKPPLRLGVGFKEGGAAFDKAFAAARKKHVAGDGPANFTYKGKRYNVQTKQDRKTTIGKAKARKAGVSGVEFRSGRAVKTIRSGRVTAERKGPAVKTIRSGRATAERKGTAIGTDKSRKSGLTTKPTTARTLVRSPVKRTGVKRSAPKGMSVEDARSAGLTGAGIRTKQQKVGTGIAKRKADTAAAQKKAAATMKKAKKVTVVIALTGGAAGLARKKVKKYAAKKAAERLDKLKKPSGRSLHGIEFKRGGVFKGTY